VLDLEDLSLRPGNPYSASSLVPPSRDPLPLGKLIAVGSLVVLGASAVGYYVLSSAQPPVAGPVASPVALPAEAPAEAVTASTPAVEQVASSAVATQAPEQAPPQPTPAEAAPAPQAVAPVAAASKASAPEVSSAAAAPAVPAEAAGSEPAAAAAEPTAREPEGPAGPEAIVAAGVPAEQPAPAAASAEPTPVVPAAAGEATTLASEAPAAALPELPTREDIVSGFEKIREGLLTCAAGKHGLVKIDATVAGTGRVAGVLIDGVFKGTPEGSCMARTVRTARFSPFSQATLKVSYPVSL
jgi:hypothetical protein